jgi:hypothetical protein
MCETIAIVYNKLAPFSQNLNDKGAITTKTKENVIFVVASLPAETRVNLSQTLDDFVKRCSFNGKDCNKAA